MRQDSPAAPMTADADAAAALAAALAATEPAYRRANDAALRHQRRHRTIVDIVAVSGTLAVVLGTVTVTQPIGTEAVRIAEACAAAAAIVAVALGIWAGSQQQWLLERHKAEQLRLIAFRALVRFTGDAGADRERWSAALHAEIAELERRSPAELSRWLTDETRADADVDDDGATVRSAAAVRAVVDDFALAAIDAQRAYFVARANADERWDARTRVAIPALFFISVAAIIPGALLRLRGDASTASAFISAALIAPAIAAGIRLFRSAHEFARNGLRFRAKALVLTMLAQRLATETASTALVRDLRYAERLFEAEHREWLQLMLDAEWYG